jgi:hypothetical protein
MLNFETQGNKKAEVLTIMDRMIPMIKSLNGCKDCLFIMHDDDYRYALLVFGETKANADAAAGFIGPQMLPALNKITKQPVTPLLFEVYQPILV